MAINNGEVPFLGGIRSILRFFGSGVTVRDDKPGNKIDIEITGGGGGEGGITDIPAWLKLGPGPYGRPVDESAYFPAEGVAPMSDGSLFRIPYGRVGTLTGLVVRVPENSSNAGTVFTVLKSGSPTAITVSFSAAETGSKTASGSVAILATDAITIRGDATGISSGNLYAIAKAIVG